MTETTFEDIPADAVTGSDKCKQESATKCTGGGACGSSLDDD